MGNCYSGDLIADDHIHKDITCKIEERQQKYRLETVSNRLLGGLNMFVGSKPTPLVSAVVQNIGSA